MADTAEEARRHARTMREIKLYGVADAMDNYAALLEAMEVRSGSTTPIQRDFVQALRQHAEDLRRG